MEDVRLGAKAHHCDPDYYVDIEKTSSMYSEEDD